MVETQGPGITKCKIFPVRWRYWEVRKKMADQILGLNHGNLNLTLLRVVLTGATRII